jgi:outer membrane protein assembly factor BamB
VAHGSVLFGQQGGDDSFHCVDAATGLPRWRFALGWAWGSANVDGQRVYVPGIDGFVNCLRLDSGYLAWRYRTGRSTCTEPVLFRRAAGGPEEPDTVLFGGWDRYLYALDVRSGTLAWKRHLGNRSDSGAQLVDGGRLYAANHSDSDQPGDVGGAGRLWCLDLADGSVRWEIRDEDVSFNATPCLDAGRLLVSTSRGRGLGGVAILARIRCYDAATGRLAWECPGGGLTAPVAAGGDFLFASTVSPWLVRIAEPSRPGGPPVARWRLRLGSKVEESTPAVYGGMLYVLCGDGYLHAVR